MLAKLVEGTKDLGVNQHITAHSFRRSFATMHYKNGTGIKDIKELMGHESIETTDRYIFCNEEDLAKLQTPLGMIRNKNKKKRKLTIHIM